MCLSLTWKKIQQLNPTLGSLLLPTLEKFITTDVNFVIVGIRIAKRCFHKSSSLFMFCVGKGTGYLNAQMKIVCMEYHNFNTSRSRFYTTDLNLIFTGSIIKIIVHVCKCCCYRPRDLFKLEPLDEFYIVACPCF